MNTEIRRTVFGWCCAKQPNIFVVFRRLVFQRTLIAECDKNRGHTEDSLWKTFALRVLRLHCRLELLSDCRASENLTS